MKVLVNIPDGEDAKMLYIAVDNSNNETIRSMFLEVKDRHAYDLQPTDAEGWVAVDDVFSKMPKGHWTREHQSYYDDLWQCSECKNHQYNASRYCSNCGAKMEEVTE